MRAARSCWAWGPLTWIPSWAMKPASTLTPALTPALALILAAAWVLIEPRVAAQPVAAAAAPATEHAAKGDNDNADNAKADNDKASTDIATALERARRKLATIRAEGLPGMSVLVARDGEVVFEQAIGLANLDDRRPVTSATKFRIGSVTKQFTAAAILTLIEDGKLQLDDPLSRFLPDFPRGDEVTIDQLLAHTSGIPSYTDDPAFMQSVTEPTTEEDLIASFAGKEFTFEPGSQYQYNNSGYFLLGHLVRRITGKPLAEYWQERFFTPLEMSDTGVHEPGLGLEDEARGYAFNGEGAGLALDWHMSRAGGAGAIYSTARDLFRWNEAVFGGKVLSDDSLAQALTVSSQSAGEANYGYGWSVDEHRGLRRVSHGGGLQGFLSYLVRYPDQRTTIVVLHNASPPVPGMVPGVVAQWLGEIFLADELEPLPVRVVDETVDPAIYDRYVGRYDYGPAVMTVRRDGNRLLTRLTDQPEFELFPESETKFFLKVVDAQVEFLTDDDGQCVAVQHTQGATKFRAARLADQELTAEQLEAFVGKYDYRTAKLRVTRDGTQLFAQLDGQPRFPIFPESEHTFAWKVVEARIEFLRDDEGRVVAAKHTQGGATFRVEKVE